MIEGEQHALLVGKPIPGKTLSDLLRRYAEEVSPTKRGGRSEVIRIKRLCRDDVADLPLTGLRRDHFSDWRDRRLKDVAAASVNREWTIFSAAINYAIREWGWLHANPLTEIKRPPVAAPRERRITADEIERILWACGYEYDNRPETVQARVGAALLFAIETAMRAGEICALTWDRVDTRRRLAHLDKTKNGYPRDVPLSTEALRIIKQLSGIDDVRVFAMEGKQLDALFRKARERAGIDGLHFHDSRREALTRMAAKVDVLTLAKISGHRDLRILSNTYYAPDMSEVAAKLD